MPESSFKRMWQEHFESGQRVLQMEDILNEAATSIADALRNGKKVLICGNGGSASDAQHAAEEFVVKMERERGPLPAIALGAHAPFLTAASNDYSFDTIFERSVRALGQPGDILIGISTSGRSENVRRAFVAASDKDLTTIALLGRDGGFTKGLADVEITVPGTSTARIQEWHIFILHSLIEMIEDELGLF